MSTKRQRRRAAGASRGASQFVGDAYAADSFQNLQARLGTGAGSISDGNDYVLSNLLTRQPRKLEFMYRGSWVVGAAVDAIADDMVQGWVDFGGSIDPGLAQAMTATVNELQVRQALSDTIRWGRLYGGSIGVIMIDGQDLATPLRLETIGRGQFAGILPLSRWELIQTLDQTVQQLGPNLGRPEIYRVGQQASGLQGATVHHTRVIRQEGVPLPYFQRLAEQGWGMSIVERMFDRLTAFDSATQGAAQLVFKSYLRTLKVQGLKQILAGPPAAIQALANNVESIRRFQTTEGLSVIDATDELQVDTYAFSGLDNVLMQFGQQISGATGIPLVRLFGMAPSGLNSNGESDLRTYYDGIHTKRETNLRTPVTKLLHVLYRSEKGDAPPPEFNFTFNPLWQMSETDKANAAKTVTEAVVGAFEAGVITKPTALRELKQSAEVTGVFSNIQDEEIVDAENEPPPMPEGEPPEAGLTQAEGEGEPEPDATPDA